MAKGLQPMKEDIRCGQCRRKLGVGIYAQLTIKCPRCGTMNHLRATRAQPEPPEGHSSEQDEWPPTPQNFNRSAAHR
jgi:phage FluMu protein Com